VEVVLRIIVALATLAIIAPGPVWAAQQPAAAPKPPLPDALQGLSVDKGTLGVLLQALSQQQPDADAKGISGAGAWQMLQTTAGSAPAVWLLNSASGQLLFCAAELKNRPGVTCYSTPAPH
jgi:hypothetical protein